MTDDTKPRKKPVVVEFDSGTGDDAIRPDLADDITDAPTQTGLVQSVVALSKPRRGLLGWMLAAVGALVSIIVSIRFWDFVQSLLDRSPILALIVGGLAVVLVVALLVVALRELFAILRLGRMSTLQAQISQAATDANPVNALAVTNRLIKLYGRRPETKWATQGVADDVSDLVDADAILALAEQRMMTPLDQAANQKVEAASRQVATVTAIVPLALADVTVALATNLRMIREISEIYGGRAGTLGSWRLARMVFSHLVATGAVAVGDDLIGSIAGGSVMGKISRKFGEGVVNGALTARVGIATIEVCRPMPFVMAKKPTVTGIISRSLTGLFK